MKKSGKILSVVLGATMLASMGALASCGQSAGGSSSEGKEVTLMIWVSKEDQAFAKATAAEFQKAHSEKKYKFLFGEQGENDAGTKVLNDPTNAPDVFSFASDQINKLINGGALARVGGTRLDRVKASNDADAVDSATVKVDGQDNTYAYPYTDNTFFLYYNKKELSETDITSIDGILAKCVAPSSGNDGKLFAYPMNDGWYSSAFFFGKGLGYEVTFDSSFAETSITTNFGNETGASVANSMWKLVQNPCVKPDSDDSKLVAGFQNGSIIAGVSGIWNKNSIEKILGDDLGVAKLPTYSYYEGDATTATQVQLVSFAGYKLMGVCNYSSVKADALDFAEFYTNKESQVRHFEMRGFRPTDKEAQQSSVVANDACCKAIAAQLAYSKTQKNVPTTLWTPLAGLGDNMITNRAGSFDLRTQLEAMVKGIEKSSSN